MKFSDVIADDDLSTACDRKTPIFNIALADSNSNAKSNPDMKVLLTILNLYSMMMLLLMMIMVIMI